MDGWNILDVILCAVHEHLRHNSIVLRNAFLGLIYVALVGQSMSMIPHSCSSLKAIDFDGFVALTLLLGGFHDCHGM